jgi:uncharacterized membrane protein YsdA (DUF1294 family)
VGAAIAGFALFFVFGIIGSIIGVKLSKNKTSKSD